MIKIARGGQVPGPRIVGGRKESDHGKVKLGRLRKTFYQGEKSTMRNLRLSEAFTIVNREAWRVPKGARRYE